MTYNFKRIFDHTVRTMRTFYTTGIRIDYKTLCGYMLNINQSQDFESILDGFARCLKDLLGYELIGLVLKNGETIDALIDSRVSNRPFFKIIEEDFFSQNIDYTIHHFDNDSPVPDQDAANFKLKNLLSYKLTENHCDARIYIIPRQKLLDYHCETINIVIRTIGMALENHVNMKKLENAATIDPLTNCYNRRALNRYIEHDIAKARRHKTDLSVIMFDLDYFKKTNDAYGHRAGDNVLQEVSKTVQSKIRKSDYLARYGGEEFVLVLPNTKFSASIELAEKLRNKIENCKLRLDNHIINTTISLGVATLRSGIDRDGLMMEADKMLYMAKASGRNIVMPNTRVCTTNIF